MHTVLASLGVRQLKINIQEAPYHCRVSRLGLSALLAFVSCSIASRALSRVLDRPFSKRTLKQDHNVCMEMKTSLALF